MDGAPLRLLNKAWLHDPIPGRGSGMGRDFVTARDVYVDALAGIDKGFTRRETVRIANVLTALGWKSSTKRFGERVVRGYYAPGHVSAAKKVVKAEENILDGLI